MEEAHVGSVVSYDGSAWSRPLAIESDTGLDGVSCASQSFCIAIDGEGNAFTYNGGSWSAPDLIDPPVNAQLEAVSCATSLFCVAVDEAGHALTYNGAWSSPTDVAGLGYHPELSCAAASPSFCVAISTTVSGATETQYALIHSGSSWGAPIELPADQEIRSVSCASASFCVAVGANRTERYGDALIYNGSSWSPTEKLDAQTLQAVSCVSSSFCAALDEGSPGYAITFNGQSWSTPVSIFPQAHFAPDESVSCVTGGFCVALSDFGEAVTYGASAAPPPSKGAEPAGPAPGNENGAGVPPASCAQSSIHFSVLSAYSACFVKHGSTWVSSGRVRINGVDITPQLGGSVEIDPSKLTLSAKLASVDLGSLLVYEGALHVNLSSPFRLSVPKETELKGIPLAGQILLEPISSGMNVTANATIGEQEGPNVTGEIKLHVTNKLGLVLENLKLAVGEIELAKPKGLKIEKAELSYAHSSSGDVWSGAVAIALPDPMPGLEGNLAITNGRLSEIGVAVSAINKPIGEVVYLQKLGLDVRWEPEVAVTGTLGLSAGPSLPVLNAPLAELETTLAVEFAQPTVITATGKVTLIGSVELANAEAKWTLPNHFEFKGEASFSEGPASIRVAGYGLVSDEGFAFKGEGEISVPDVSGSGLAYMSEKGITGCAQVTTGPLTVYGGFGYHWGGELELWADNCEMLKFKTSAHLSAISSGAVSFQVPAGQAEALIGARGEGGYPSYTLRSPSGQLITRSSGEQGAVGAGGYRWVTDPPRNGSYVLLGRPQPGTWTLTPLAGSAKIDWTGSALGAPPVRVKARVIRRGRRDVLSWSARAIPGQALRFEEVGKRTGDVILKTSKAHGRITFTPADTGYGEARHLQIEVSMEGLPRKTLTGPSFLVRAPAHPLAPRRISIVRDGHGVRISWRPVGGRASFEVLVLSSDGRRERFHVRAGQHSLIFPDVIAPAHLSVSVATVAPDGLESRPGRAQLRLRTPAAHRKHRPTHH